MKYDLEQLTHRCRQIARQAGERILEIYQGRFEIRHKDDNTPVTSADIAAHHIIARGLKRLTPEIPVLSEESTIVPYEIRKRWERYWLVDPLDGTCEFIKHNGEFSVNIALIEHHCSILGVIYGPAVDLEYFAWKNGGAFKCVDIHPPHPIHVRPLGENKVVVAGSRSHGSPALRAYLSKLGDVEFVKMGSSLKSCLVAEGKADLYPRLGLTAEWDTGAAQCIVEQAGGRLTDTRMQPLRYNTKDSLLNPEFFVFGDPTTNWSRYLA